METVNLFEKLLVDDGIQIIKFWFSIDINEQKKRLDDRKTNPLQHWKLSTVDAVAQQKWEDYTKYKQEMFSKTSTPHCPWVIIKGNDKDIARLEAIRYVINHTDYPKKDISEARLSEDPEVVTILNSDNNL